MEYTFEMLLNEIYEFPNEREGMAGSSDKAKRELQSKQIVMQMLINLANRYKAGTYNDEVKLLNAIGDEVSRDELLSGYAFFVPQNPQFDYTWSYMRKRKKSYIEFLVKAVGFLNNVLSDINILAQESRKLNDVHFLFNDIFEVAFMSEAPNGKITMRWENFYRIAAIKNCYNVVAKMGESVLVSRDRKNADDVNELMNEAFKITGTTI